MNRAIAMLAASIALWVVGSVHAQTAGALDTSFSGDGKIIISVPGYTLKGNGVAVNSQGKIVVAGTATSSTATPTNRYAVVVLNTDGTLDTNFGTGGIKLYVPYQLGPEANAPSCFGKAVAVLADDSIIVGGNATNRFVLSKLSSTGAEDTSFNGVATWLGDTDGVGVTAELNALMVYPYYLDGQPRIATTGSVNSSMVDTPTIRYVTLPIQVMTTVQFTTGGTLEETYNSEYGNPPTRATAGWALTYDFAISDGIWVGGRKTDASNTTDKAGFGLPQYPFALMYQLPNEPAFSAPSQVRAMERSADGSLYNVLATGATQTDGICIWKMEAFAAQDPLFGEAHPSVSVSAAAAPGFIPFGISVRTDGRILVGATSATEFALLRFNAGGALDSTFDSDGKITTAVGTGAATAGAMAVQSDGKALLAGSALDAGATDAGFAVVRYETGPLAADTPPEFLDDLNTEYIVNYGEDLTLSVNTSSNLPVRYQWYVNGVAITGATDKSYTIVKPVPKEVEHVNTYKVVARNLAGEVESKAARIWVSSQLHLIADPVQIFMQNSYSRVRYQAWEVPENWPLQISWYDPDTNTNLYNGDLVPSKPGIYHRVASTFSSYGAIPYAQVPIKIIVTATEPAAAAPAAQLFAVGDFGSIKLDAWLSTYLPAIFQWQKNGKTIDSGEELSSTTRGFSPATLSSAGAYRVKISNPKASGYSTTTQVGVVDTTNQSTVLTGIGKSPSLTAPAAGNGLSFVWYKGNTELTESKRLVGTHAKTLTIRGVVADDADAYTCKVSNGNKTLTTAAIGLAVVHSVPVLTLASLPTSTVQHKYSVNLAEATTVKASSYGATNLPPGLVLDKLTGIISGRPTKAGDFSVVIGAANVLGAMKNITVPLHINPLPAGMAGTYLLIGGTPDFRATITITEAGTYSGKLTIFWPPGSTTLPVAGSLPFESSAYTSIQSFGLPRNPGGYAEVSMNFNWDSGIVGSLQLLDGPGPAMTSFQSYWNPATRPATAYAAYYTAVLTPEITIDNDSHPWGTGYAGITVTPGGTATCAGRLSNGAAFTSTSFISAGGDLPLVTLSTDSKSSLGGVLHLTPGPNVLGYGASVRGALGWSLVTINDTAGNGIGNPYHDGFTALPVEVKGVRYLPPNVPLISGPIAMDLPDGPNNVIAGVQDTFFFYSSHTGRLLTNHRGAFTAQAQDKGLNITSLAIAPTTGIFSGSATLYLDNGTGGFKATPVTFMGAITRDAPSNNLGFGSGYYLRTTTENFTNPVNDTPYRTQISGLFELIPAN